MKKITEATAVSLSLVVILAGGIFWLSSLYAKVEANTQKVAMIENVLDRLARIEEKLNFLIKKESEK